MTDTSSASTSVVYELSKYPNKEDVIYQKPSTVRSSLNNTNNSNKIQHQSQMGSRNNAASTKPIINPQLSRISSIHKISTYQTWSILNILFCCLCLGCIACRYSTETERLKAEGNIQAALKASKHARNLNIIGTICGTIIIIISVYVTVFQFNRV